MKRPTLNFTYSVWLAVIFSVGKAISEFKTITESWKTKDEMKIMGVNSWYCGRRGVPKISVPGSRERVATGHSKTICCLFPSFITGRMARSGGVPSREEKDEACSNKALRWNRLHMLLSEAIRSAVFCYLIYLFEKRKMFEHSRSGRGLTHRKPTHKHMGRVQVGGQMALNSLPLGRGHQRSLCVLLSIYFTHHPSSGRDDPATLELGLPVSWPSIHEHWAWCCVNICSVRERRGI